MTLFTIVVDDSFKFGVIEQAKSFDVGLDVALFNFSLTEEKILSSHFLSFDDIVDHTGRELLSSNQLVHFLLGLELGLL